MLKLKWPRCGSNHIFTRCDGTCFCSQCGYEGKKEQFITDFEKRLKVR